MRTGDLVRTRSGRHYYVTRCMNVGGYELRPVQKRGRRRSTAEAVILVRSAELVLAYHYLRDARRWANRYGSPVAFTQHALLSAREWLRRADERAADTGAAREAAWSLYDTNAPLVSEDAQMRRGALIAGRIPAEEMV